MYDESFIHLEQKMLLDFSQKHIPRWHIFHDSMGSDAGWKVGGTVEGKFSHHNFQILKKALSFCKKVGGGGMPCVHFLLASKTLYFPSILSLSINTSDSSSAS